MNTLKQTLAGIIPNAGPTEESTDNLVIEIRPPGREVWIPQTVNVNGEQRIALCKTEQRDRVVEQLEIIYGVGNVRTLAERGYKPDPEAERVRSELQGQTIQLQPGGQLGGGLASAKMIGAILTVYLLVEGVGEMPFNIVMSPDGDIGVCPNGPGGEIDENTPLWQGTYDTPEAAQLRNGVNLVFQFLLGRMPEMLARFAELVKRGGDVPRAS